MKSATWPVERELHRYKGLENLCHPCQFRWKNSEAKIRRFTSGYRLLSYFCANSFNSNLFRNSRYLSRLVSAHCWQKHSSVGTKELKGNGPLGAFLRETRNRCRGRILWSKDKLRYMGYLVNDFTSLRSSLIRYMYLGFKLSSKDREKTCSINRSG